MKMHSGFIILYVIVTVLYGLLLELSLNTVPGWILFGILMTAFFIFRMKVLDNLGILPRLGAWCVLFVALFLIFKITYPPYALVPAVREKNPEATGVVTVAQGDLTGVYNGDRSVEVYAGIPYAKPPVGNLRWKEPQAPDSWSGVRVCDHFAPRFMQNENSTLWDNLVMLVIYNEFEWFDPSNNYREELSEDALYVNVWKPAGDISDCPVIFFVHGGSLQTGTPSYDQYNGEAFAKRGIVFVDFGYRLNVFGYFADEALAAESPNGTTGNYGLLDQIAALQWVHDNIAAFGGDPDNITIAGESAGSSSVGALCVSPLTEGLFRRAIAESSGICVNTPYHTFRAYDEALEMKQKVYDMFGAKSVEDLRSLPARELVKAVGAYNSMTVDGYAITEQPAETYRKGENHEEALLNGYNATEADVFTILGTKVTKENYKEILEGEIGEATEDVLALYPGTSHPKDDYNAVMSAAWFAYSHYTWSRLMAAEGRPVYHYWFTRTNKGLSANHAGEMPYFYGNLDTQPQNYTPWDHELSETIMDYIENFARIGNPNGDGLPAWPDFSEDPTQVLEFGDHIGLTTNVYLDVYHALDKAQEWAE
ncbi:MAG: carboxylesterase family protein [Lachnospiraceae bacterium]|nr:carboxylesterase family protein [Lachnospiraceae bacterium]